MTAWQDAWQDARDQRLTEARAATDAMTPQEHYERALDIVYRAYEPDTTIEAIHAKAQTHILLAQLKLAAGAQWDNRSIPS